MISKLLSRAFKRHLRPPSASHLSHLPVAESGHIQITEIKTDQRDSHKYIFLNYYTIKEYTQSQQKKIMTTQ